MEKIMSQQKPFSSLTGFALAALVVALVGTGFALWTGFNLSQRSPTVTVDPDKPDMAIPGQAQIYWLSNNDTAIAFVPQNIPPNNDPPAVQTERALKTLLAAPNNQISAIPPNTSLLSLTKTPTGINVDLSAQFTAGGGSQSMIARLGQIVYTATSTDPNLPVLLLVEGEPLTVLGGEGLMIAQPITRKQFETDFMPPDR
ncbi:GerMN domain-containing protein [Synechocystis salina LEGE 00031]|uniref:GerMN domain-containing protein n=2 Tax=Synechocystis TaxID=1142 RepID=A0ABR9VRC6_9SYNC|nr:GerMN domain-containing protein [Synechocystis salina LEGE 00041]MBE9253906.1 GerMN domain-containing protein [Synechocystis salina LEGE 00031]